MKNKEALKKSYEKQLNVFNNSKETKLRNLEEREQSIRDKVLKLEAELEKISLAKETIRQKRFPSLEEYVNQAREQSTISASE